MKNQIKTLFITIYNSNGDEASHSSVAKIFDRIFTVFTGLTTVVLNESWCYTRVHLLFHNPFYPNIRCSTLLKLIITVQDFDDCLYLLDGRYDQLHTIHVDLGDTLLTTLAMNQVSFIQKMSIL